MRLWFLTNGLGEDRAAALVARSVAERQPAADILAATLVTPGVPFTARGFRVVVAGVEPPSGGVPFGSLGIFVRDLPAIPACYRYVRDLHRLAQRDDVVVVAGDTFLLGLGRRAFRRPAIHIALAKSVHGRRHSRVEHALLRRWASVVFARDESTAARLRAHGVRSEFLGNPLIDGDFSSAAAPGDALSRTGPAQFSSVTGCQPCDSRSLVVLLLPGSRVEAPANLVRLLEVVSHVPAAARWLCAWPESVPLTDGVRAATQHGWMIEGDCVKRGARTVLIAAGRFDDFLPSADVVLGLAGTANEQAAAMGKPVVTFVGAGAQTCAARMREQERLLGGAARFLDRDARTVAAEVAGLLDSPAERARRGRLGIARLGPPGAAARIADRIVAHL